MLEGFPGLASGEPGSLTQPVDALVATILGLFFQHFKEGGQNVAVAGVGETCRRLGAHAGHLELMAQLADALLHHAGVSVHHPHTPTTVGLLTSRPS